MDNFVSLFTRSRPGGFESLVEPHMEHLYRLAYRFTGGREDAEDLVQELLYRLYPKVSTLRGVESLRPWLSRALYNLFIDTARRRRNDPLTGADGEEALGSEESTGTPEGETELMRVQRRIEVALQRLGPDERALITMHDIEGYTLTELESTLEIPLGTLKSRLHRSRRKLREALKKGNLSPATFV